MFAGELTKAFEKLGADRHHSGPATQWLQDDRGYVFVFAQSRGNAIEVASLDQHRAVRDPGQYSGGRGAVVRRLEAGGHLVTPAMKMTRETQDLMSTGSRAGYTNSHLGCLGTRGREPYSLG